LTLTRAGLPDMLRGIWDRLQGLSRIRRWAAAVGLGWAVLVGAYGIGFLSVVGAGRGTVFLDAMFFLVALVLPLLLIGLAAWLAEELERQRAFVAALAEVTAPLIGALAATREAVDRHGAVLPEAIQKAVQGALLGSRPDFSVPLDRLLGGQARIEAALQRLAAAPPPQPVAPVAAEPATPAAEPPPAPPEAQAETRQPLLPMLPTEEAPARPDWQDLVRALDFPRDADDRAGFRALKVALRHHGLAQMLQAAEDVLNLLSQEGVFVDELPMAPVDTGAWRRFMAGKRGPEVVGVGGISDARALEAARGLMRSDSIFRDSALFFQRRFDGVLSEFCSGASDGQMEELAGTRSGRAFMLMVRLSGSLD
jgi:hypothetical protein